jgi:hypothetical protein
VREGTEVHDKMVLIGMSSLADPKLGLRKDNSKVPKKGQLGIVDKTFITEGEEGERIAKVRVREIRIPAIGDKMASRAGQKGTIGLVIPESDMPFTRDGIIPDIIINPHAVPSRMTIGHLVECITGKACSAIGCFGDATAFNNDGTKIAQFGRTLVNNGFHSSGNDILYNGMTGEQIESEIFFGPTYYMRLKHMVKDKINYRAKGPRTALTRQTVSGRANDGGLRIGEMERDGIISHGATNFLTESMMERGDKYYMSVCNKTGMVAVYNPSKNLFISPMADGPIKFVGTIAENNIKVENITKHGRSFSVVCIPYTLKLLMQELQCANVALRIITDDNIEQIENMSFSKNIDLLTKKENNTVESIVKEIQLNIRKMNQEPNLFAPATQKNDDLEGYVPEKPTEMAPIPGYSDSSPPYTSEFNPASPVYAPGLNPLESPPYGPETSINTESPPYAAEFNSNSPAYPPVSPEEQMKSGGAINDYHIGQTVSLRGHLTGGKANNWRILDITPEFTTVSNDDEMLVVDNNEICPYIQQQQQPQQQYYNPNLMQQSYDQMYQMPLIKPEEKPVAPVNVVVVTGDKNELSGLTSSSSNDIQSGGKHSNSDNNSEKKQTEKQAEKKGGESTGSSILDFTKSFFIKKVDN